MIVTVGSTEPGAVGSYTLAVKTRTDPVSVNAGVVRGVLGLVSRIGPGGRRECRHRDQGHSDCTHSGSGSHDGRP